MMALSSTALSLAIFNALKGEGWVNEGPELTTFCDAIASAVVSHITSAAVVSTTVTGTAADPISGALPLTASGTGTVS